MKIGIFSDPHYSTASITCGKRYNSKALSRIQMALDYFAAEKCDLAVCLGDLIDKEPEHKQEIINLQKVASVFQASPLKIVVVMGNHDAFAFGAEEFYSILGKDCEPHPICADGNYLLFLDACYFKSGIHYRPGDEDWTDTFFPKTDELEHLLSSRDDHIHLFLHQNIDPAISQDHRLYNADEICAMAEKHRNVRAVYQGHYHPGMKSEYHGIPYITFPAMCENDDAFYIIEI